MVAIVYVGAMMILIGYVCAVSPNLNLEPNFRLLHLLGVGFLLALFLFTTTDKFMFNQSYTLSDFIYSAPGLSLFFSVVFMLLLTLFIVTSQFALPRGPFRSI